MLFAPPVNDALRRAASLPGIYFLYFASVGITLPFLPAYFASVGLSPRQIGALLSVGPAMAMVAPSFWGHLADRTGRPDRILTAVAFGALCGLSSLLWFDGFFPLLVALGAYAFFTSAITPLLDSMTLHQVESSGGSYAAVRVFGSFGFVLASVGFGLSVPAVDRLAVLVPLGFIAGYLLWSLLLEAPARAFERSQNPFAGLGLLRNRDLLWFLLACTLHWISCAPYHGSLALHIGALGLPPSVVGFSAGLGVVAEIAAMFAYPNLSKRFAPRHLLAASFFATVLRWAGMAVAQSAVAIILLQALHGLSFGLFYVAAVSFVSRRVPSQLRATGQALFVSITFGLGGLVGFTGAGAAYELLGGHRLFGAAALLELAPALLALTLRPPAKE